MIVRAQQFEAFQPQADASLVRKIIEFLRKNHAEALVELPDRALLVNSIPDETLYAMIQTGIACARGYGMHWESSLGAFVVLMFVAAPNFDDHPLIQRILKDESIEPDSRIDQLWERTSDQNWEAIQQNYDPSFWIQKAPENAQ